MLSLYADDLLNNITPIILMHFTKNATVSWPLSAYFQNEQL